jgi:hypothetical protein
MVVNFKGVKTVLFWSLINGFLILIWISPNIMSHSPYDLELNYDVAEEVLSADFSHSVSEPNSHYIELVLIKVNGDLVINKSYENQPSSDPFTYKYDITANDGDNIEVFASCNQGGNITQSLIVDEESKGNTRIPGFIGVNIAIFVNIFFIILISWKKLNTKNSQS